MRNIILFGLALLLLPLATTAQENVPAKVDPKWESLNQRPYPQWFKDAKLGIFIHWGLYSVPAYAGKEGYAEWFYRGLMTGVRNRKAIMSLYADTTTALFDQYAALTDHWHGELWQPDQWASLFRKAGARYVLLVTKHHDGYCLWDSPYQPTWNSTMSGPRRNIVEELTNAVRGQGLRMGFYYSLPEWTNPRHIWMQDPDDSIADYVENYMVPQFKELVNRYRPDIIFSDGDWQNSAEQFHSAELISWYYNTVGADAIVNNRWGNGTQHGFKTPEYSAGLLMEETPWAECRGIGRSFGFNRNEDIDNFLTDKELIQHFCELVANGGGLTLNVGPMADGTIPFIQQERLLAIGRWLETNGEAIYGSQPWTERDCRNNIITNNTIYSRTTSPLPTSTAIDFDWVRNAPLKGMPVDNFDIHWHASVTVAEEGDYTFTLEADDEAWVVFTSAAAIVDSYVSADLSVATGKTVNPSEKPDTLLYYNKNWAENDRGSKTVHLQKGDFFEIDIHYHEKDLESTVSLKWSKDGGEAVPVPAQWNGTAEWSRTVRCFTTVGHNLYMIEFERPTGNTLTVHGLPTLPKGTEMQMLGTSAKLKWKQHKDGRTDIDLTTIDATELNALSHAWVIRCAYCL